MDQPSSASIAGIHSVALNIHGGGRLVAYGPLTARRLLIILSRENFKKDELLIERMSEFFARQDFTVVRYEPATTLFARTVDRHWVRRLPRALQPLARAALLCAHPRHWQYYSSRRRARHNAIDYRTQSLRELVELLGSDKEIVLLTRSASGRAASLIADQSGIFKLVCLGYPFRHPTAGDEPERYQHLEQVETPFLIIQGTRDIYGGAEIVEKYKFSRNTTIHWVDTDHDFVMSDEEWRRILHLILHFVAH